MPDILAVPAPPPLAPLSPAKSHGCGCFGGARAFIVVSPYVSKRRVRGDRGGGEKVEAVKAVKAVAPVQAAEVFDLSTPTANAVVFDLSTPTANSVRSVPSMRPVPVLPIRSSEAPPLQTAARTLDDSQPAQKATAVAEDRDRIIGAVGSGEAPPLQTAARTLDASQPLQKATTVAEDRDRIIGAVGSGEAPPLQTVARTLDASNSAQKATTVAEDRDRIIGAKQSRFGRMAKDHVRREAKGTVEKIAVAGRSPVPATEEELRDSIVRATSEKYGLGTRPSSERPSATEGAGEVLAAMVPQAEALARDDSEFSGTELRDLRISSRAAKWSSGSRKLANSADSLAEIPAAVEVVATLESVAGSLSAASADPRDRILSGRKQRYALTARSEALSSYEARMTGPPFPSKGRTTTAKSELESLTETELRDLRLKRAREKYAGGGSVG